MHDSLLFHVPSINAPFQEVARIYKADCVEPKAHTRLYTFTQDIDGHQDVHRDQGNQEHIDRPYGPNGPNIDFNISVTFFKYV